ncbi:SAM-dependent methyltransferase [Aeromicrobium sp. Root344]|uniref:class I SAM-dependent methyltransferase n=1 Tax=Aeromicrobium sp. Root344 TaxID=1736521 RepID=UPI0006F968A4|nr:class I SAM-dependent methyltransferase [Aeromicrobium sp. Root344]KQV74626.1 SAM-dependent methyltransferase [Aeromicrobium sp. Root344]
MSTGDPDARTRELASAGEPTAWFEELYAEAADGRATVPWDREAPTQLVQEWIAARPTDDEGRSAIVVGCGYGRDAELVARHGYRTTGFDISPTAIGDARQRHTGSPVDYRVADLLDLPAEWHRAFDLVVESMNVQALPVDLRPAAIDGVRSLVAPGGTLFVVAVARDDGVETDGPPWPLDRAEIEAFGTGLVVRSIERIVDANDPGISRWTAELTRDDA